MEVPHGTTILCASDLHINNCRILCYIEFIRVPLAVQRNHVAHSNWKWVAACHISLFEYSSCTLARFWVMDRPMSAFVWICHNLHFQCFECLPYLTLLAFGILRTFCKLFKASELATARYYSSSLQASKLERWKGENWERWKRMEKNGKEWKRDTVCDSMWFWLLDTYCPRRSQAL